MSEGRGELERAIEVWERRHVVAVQSKREAEVVLPFLRAAIEELDSFQAGDSSAAVAKPSPLGQAAGEPPSVFESRRGIAALMPDEEEGAAAG